MFENSGLPASPCPLPLPSVPPALNRLVRDIKLEEAEERAPDLRALHPGREAAARGHREEGRKEKGRVKNGEQGFDGGCGGEWLFLFPAVFQFQE